MAAILAKLEESRMPGESRSPALRYALGSLLVFGALNAFAGGYHGLAGSPFTDYFIRSVILFVVAGGAG